MNNQHAGNKSNVNIEVLKFELYSSYNRSSFNTNDLFQALLGASVLIFLSISFFDDYINIGYTFIVGFSTLIILLFLLSKSVSVISFFSKYEHEKEVSGTITFKVDNIEWCDNVVEWNRISSFYITMNEIESVHKFDSSSANNVSDGINRIDIKTLDGDKFGGWYLLTSLESKHRLHELMKKSIFKNKISYEVAKSILNPSTYREHQILKEKLKANNDRAI